MKLDSKSGFYLPKPIRRYSPEEQRRAERKWNRDWWRHRLAVTLVQAKPGANNFGGTTSATTFASTAGTGILCATAIWVATSGTPTLVSISDDKSNTWTLGSFTNQTGAGYTAIGCQCGYVIGPTTGVGTITAHFSANVSAGLLSIYELTTGAYDSNGDLNHQGTTTTPSAGSYSAPTGWFAIAGYCSGDGYGGGGSVAGSGWTLNLNSGGGNADFATEYPTSPGTTGTITGNFTAAASGGNNWNAAMLAFKPSGGGGGSPLFLNQGDLNGMGVGGPFFKNPIG